MDSRDLTRQQAETILVPIVRQKMYLAKLLHRMGEQGFPDTDPVFVSTRAAFEATHTLWVQLHYISCGKNETRQAFQWP